MQWAALAKLAEVGECSQNLLGRLVAMDVATIKGVVERLVRRGFAATRPTRTIAAGSSCARARPASRPWPSTPRGRATSPGRRSGPLGRDERATFSGFRKLR